MIPLYMVVDLTDVFLATRVPSNPRASRFVVAQVAARGLCGPRPEAFRSFSLPRDTACVLRALRDLHGEVFENEHLHENGVGGTSAMIEAQG